MTEFGKLNGPPVACGLTPGERITQVTMYKGLSSKNHHGLNGVQFTTNVKQCPLFGNTSSDFIDVSGHRLLVLELRQGFVVMKKMTLYFDYDCQHL